MYFHKLFIPTKNETLANVDTMKCNQCAFVRIMARYKQMFMMRKKRFNYRKRVRMVVEISENVNNQKNVYVGDSFQKAIAPGILDPRP